MDGPGGGKHLAEYLPSVASRPVTQPSQELMNKTQTTFTINSNAGSNEIIEMPNASSPSNFISQQAYEA